MLPWLICGPKRSSFWDLRNDLVAVGEGVFSGNVCIKVQAEFGEGKQRTLCSTGGIDLSTVWESLGQGVLTSPRSQTGSWFAIFGLSVWSVLPPCQILARAP